MHPHGWARSRPADPVRALGRDGYRAPVRLRHGRRAPPAWLVPARKPGARRPRSSRRGGETGTQPGFRPPPPRPGVALEPAQRQEPAQVPSALSVPAAGAGGAAAAWAKARAGHRRRPPMQAWTALLPDVGLVRARAVASQGWARRRGSIGPRAWALLAGLLPQAWGSQPGRMCRTQPGALGTLRPEDARPVPGMPRAWGPAAAQRVSGRRYRSLLRLRGASARCRRGLPRSASRRTWAEWELRQVALAQGRPPSVPASVRQCWARQASAPACRRWPPQPLACPGPGGRRRCRGLRCGRLGRGRLRGRRFGRGGAHGGGGLATQAVPWVRVVLGAGGAGQQQGAGEEEDKAGPGHEGAFSRISMRRFCGALGSAVFLRLRSARPSMAVTRFSSRPPRTSM